MDIITAAKVNYLTQAIWRLQIVKSLVDLSPTPSQMDILTQLTALIESIEADVAEMHDPVDI